MKSPVRWGPALLGLACVSAAIAASGRAEAHLFLEDWESGTSQWRTAGGGPVIVDVDPTTCSTRYQRETVPWTGSRVLSKAAFAVVPGQNYCLTAWVRASAGSKPLLGLQRSDGAGTPVAGAELWLVGGTVAVVADGTWRYYKVPLVMPAGWSFLVVADALAAGGGMGSTADFDDINFDASVCPTSVIGAPHQACAAPRPLCTDAGQCVQCTAADSSACQGTTPECDLFAGICIGCTSDFECGDPRPVCDTNKHVCVAAPADLGAGDLSMVDLAVVDLAAADLAGADLVAADLVAADLAVADLAPAPDLSAIADASARTDFAPAVDFFSAPDLPAPPDAGPAPDAAAPPNAGGCSCSAGANSARSAPFAPLLVVVALCLSPLIRTRFRRPQLRRAADNT